MEIIPIEILTLILLIFPVKSLLRLKCVCKTWNSLIKSPNFIKLHFNQTLISNSDLHLLVFHPYHLHKAELNLHRRHLSFSELHHPPQPEPGKGIHFFGSCNGVVCISDSSKNHIFVYNPLINSHRKLPEYKIPRVTEARFGFGFGYDSKNDDYKVLRIIQGFQMGEVYYTEAQVYSLNNNSWKSEIIPGFQYCLPYNFCHGVLVNQTLHYIVCPNDLSFPPPYILIASFDLRTHSFLFTDCPYSDWKYSYPDLDWPLLSELDGCLCATVNYPLEYMGTLDRADTWILKEYGNEMSWVRFFSVYQPRNIRKCWMVKPLLYSKDERRILIKIYYMCFYKVGWYDLETRNAELFTTHGMPDSFNTITVFVASLVLLGDNPRPPKETLLRKNKKKIRKNKRNMNNFSSTGSSSRLT